MLSDNYEHCKKHLLNLHKKLRQDPELMKKYLFKEQKDLGIIEEVSEFAAYGEIHYIPHHPVKRDDHSTTKLRIVFDASSKTDGPSLNDCLYKGPQMTPLIYDILLILLSRHRKSLSANKHRQRSSQFSTISLV